MILNLKAHNVLAFLLCFLIFLSCSPTIFHEVFVTMVLGAVVVYFLFFVLHIIKNPQTRYPKRVLFMSLMIFIYSAIPFRIYDRFSPSVVWLVVFCTILFLQKDIVWKSFRFFYNIIFVVSLLAVINYFLCLIGLKLPSALVILSDNRSFDFYPGTIVLTNQYYSLFGQNVFRLCGVFGEPGHFGLILIMFFYLNFGILKTFKGKIVMLAGVLTMSFAFYTLLAGLIAYIMIKQRKFVKFLSISIGLGAIVIILYSVIPIEVLERFFLNKADAGLDKRTSIYFQLFYDNFLNGNNLIFGMGNDVLSVFDLTSSDYRAYIVRYGFFGCIMYFLWFFGVNSRKNNHKIFLSFFYFLVVFAHRSWFIDYLVFLCFIYIMALSVSNSKSLSHE